MLGHDAHQALQGIIHLVSAGAAVRRAVLGKGSASPFSWRSRPPNATGRRLLADVCEPRSRSIPGRCEPLAYSWLVPDPRVEVALDHQPTDENAQVGRGTVCVGSCRGHPCRGHHTDDPERAANQFRAAIGNIRKTLRDATGTSNKQFVTYSADRYRLDSETIDVDLWRFTHHLHTVDGDDPTKALAAALGDYNGDLTDGHTYEWAEPLRESLHRQAVDAYARLAEEHEHSGETQQAVTTLEHALALDSYNEDLYQRSIRLLGELGRTDAIRRLYRHLQNKLADLDIDPDPATEHLVSSYLPGGLWRPPTGRPDDAMR
ncbi:MAG: hypothetical protein GEV10_18320 [Streptosporangiales bacterium]|nr:hypothetical protein [Streptosporangiales bacterium]